MTAHKSSDSVARLRYSTPVFSLPPPPTRPRVITVAIVSFAGHREHASIEAADEFRLILSMPSSHYPAAVSASRLTPPGFSPPRPHRRQPRRARLSPASGYSFFIASSRFRIRAERGAGYASFGATYAAAMHDGRAAVRRVKVMLSRRVVKFRRTALTMPRHSLAEWWASKSRLRAAPVISLRAPSSRQTDFLALCRRLLPFSFVACRYRNIITIALKGRRSSPKATPAMLVGRRHDE